MASSSEVHVAASTLLDALRGDRVQPIRPPGFVYYAVKGDLIKIGYTALLHGRMSALRPDELLAVELGSFPLERQRQNEFSAAHARGRDWFYPTLSLLHHIADLAARPGGKPSWAPLPRGGTPETRRRGAERRAARRASSPTSAITERP